ncbi:MAG: hypothetical protein JO250_10480 [Armatimonadetes bacterium]|nr:hypothetical protein [Armatimonadota bacterium]
MQVDQNTLITVGVFAHLGASLAKSLLHSRTDRAKIDALTGRLDGVLGLLTNGITPPAPSNGGEGPLAPNNRAGEEPGG